MVQVTDKTRSRLQLFPGYLNSFETVISALKNGGKQAQDAGYIAHGACLLHAAVELEAILAERVSPIDYTLPKPTEKMLLAGSMVDWRKYADKTEAALDVWNVMHRNAPSPEQGE